jgi:serine/threonine protein kinase
MGRRESDSACPLPTRPLIIRPYPAPMALASGARLGPYEIILLLGAGGMGEVYRARDTRLNRIVAIKVLAASVAMDAECRERFEREAQTIAALNHPSDQAGNTDIYLQALAG